jgi:hypothetical protein
MQKKIEQTAKSGGAMEDSKKRLLRIALQTSVCLLLSLAATVVTLVQLDDWSKSSDRWLECTINESFWTRNWDMYDLTAGRAICTPDTLDSMQGSRPCVSDCFFYPDVDARHPMICAIEEGVDLESVVAVLGNNGDGDYLVTYTYCDCGCGDYQPVEKPSLFTMTVAFLAQVNVPPTATSESQ